MSHPRQTLPSSPEKFEERYRLFVESVQDYSLIMLDPEGTIVSWNLGAQRMEGYSAAEVVGRPFSIFYPREAHEADLPRLALETAFANGRFEDENWRIRKDGSRFWAHTVTTAMFDDDGAHRGFAEITRDLTEKRDHQERMRQSEEQFQLLLESVTDYAIFMLDTGGKVRSWNAGAAAIKGYAASEIIGSHFSVFYRAEDIALGKPVSVLQRALREGHAFEKGWRVRKDGSVFWADVTVTPVYDAKGAPRGYAKVTRDATERRRLMDLETSSRRMMEFLATLGHELRNPLTPIRNSVYLLKMGSQPTPAQRRPIDILERQTEHLTRLVDDLLDIGRITSGKIELKLEGMDLVELVRRSAEIIQPELAAREQTLELSLPAHPVWVRGDETRLAQALYNLLGNASKFTPTGGQILIETRSGERIVTTTVRDNGRGMTRATLDRIFDLFVQESAGNGLGIGLSLARQLVELHGGSLTGASPGPGLGSSFAIRLPIALEAPRTAPAASPRNGEADTDRRPSYRVLVVDDNEDAADTFVELLELLGHEVRAAHDGVAALELAEQFRPQVVFLDLNMPRQDGFTVIERLHGMASLGPLFVAAVTGYGQREDRQRTQEAGFDAHLTKPVSLRQLRQVLAEVPERGGPAWRDDSASES